MFEIRILENWRVAPRTDVELRSVAHIWYGDILKVESATDPWFTQVKDQYACTPEPGPHHLYKTPIEIMGPLDHRFTDFDLDGVKITCNDANVACVHDHSTGTHEGRKGYINVSLPNSQTHGRVAIPVPNGIIPILEAAMGVINEQNDLYKSILTI